MKTMKIALIASTVLLASGGAVFAAPVLGLTGEKTLVLFDTASPAVTKTMEVTGVDSLVGIDFRPSNKTVVGVTPDSRIVTIDLETGAATDVAKMNTPLPIDDAAVVVDFNPMADRLRFMTGTTNHRVHPDTGEVTVDGKLAYRGRRHAQGRNAEHRRCRLYQLPRQAGKDRDVQYRCDDRRLDQADQAE